MIIRCHVKLHRMYHEESQIMYLIPSGTNKRYRKAKIKSSMVKSIIHSWNDPLLINFVAIDVPFPILLDLSLECLGTCRNLSKPRDSFFISFCINLIGFFGASLRAFSKISMSFLACSFIDYRTSITLCTY
jgi:hypothetical protein